MASGEDIANRVDVNVGGAGVVKSPDQPANFLISADKDSITSYSRENGSLVILFENGKTVKIIDFFNNGLDSNNLIFVDNGNKWLTHFGDALTPNEDGIVDTDVYYEDIGWNYSGASLLSILGGAAVVAGSLAALLSDGDNETVARTSGPEVHLSVGDDRVPADGAYISNPEPKIHGSNAVPNEKVLVAVDDHDPTIVDVVADGSWSCSIPDALADGEHDITVTPVDQEGKPGASSTVTFTVDTLAPAAAVLESVHDNAGSVNGDIVEGANTDDATPLLFGTAEAGSLIRVYDENHNVVGKTETGSDGSWSLELSQTLGVGEHVLTVTATDAAGTESEPSDGFALVVEAGSRNRDTIASEAANSSPVSARSFMAPAFAADFEESSDQFAPDDDARSLLANGGATDDDSPLLSGADAIPGGTVTIYDNGEFLGEAVVESDGTWSYVPVSPLDIGAHALCVTMTDHSGNVSPPSELFTLVVEAALPEALPASDAGAVHDDIIVLTGDTNEESGQDAADSVADIADYLSPSVHNGDTGFDMGANGQDGFFEPLAVSSLVDTQLDLATMLACQQIVV